MQVRWKSLLCIHREFSYILTGDKKNFENRSTFAKIIKHQVASFPETQCTYYVLQTFIGIFIQNTFFVPAFSFFSISAQCQVSRTNLSMLFDNVPSLSGSDMYTQ